MTEISKTKLVTLLQDCASGSITRTVLQEWMIHNFDPPEDVPEKSLPEYVQKAMSMVMNEYELVELDKIRDEGFRLAIDFIQCDPSDFDSKGQIFIRDGFVD